MQSRMTRFVAGGIAVAAITAALGGAAFAQTPPATPSGTPPASIQQRGQELLDALAGKLGKTSAEVRAAIVAVEKDRVAQEVQAGRLTQAQADQLNQRIDASNGLGLLRGGPGGPGGHRGPGGPGHLGGPGVGDPAALAQFLGVQPTELMQQLQAGKSLAQVAQERGKSRDDLKTYLTTQEKAKLAAAVQAGRLTQAQADQKLAELTSRLDQQIDRTGPVGGSRGRGGPGKFRGGPGPGGAAPAQPGTPAQPSGAPAQPSGTSL